VRPSGEPAPLPEEIAEFINRIWEQFGHLSEEELEEYAKDEVWRRYREGFGETEKSDSTMTKENIRGYYRSLSGR